MVLLDYSYFYSHKFYNTSFSIGFRLSPKTNSETASSVIVSSLKTVNYFEIK